MNATTTLTAGQQVRNIHTNEIGTIDFISGGRTYEVLYEDGTRYRHGADDLVATADPKVRLGWQITEGDRLVFGGSRKSPQIGRIEWLGVETDGLRFASVLWAGHLREVRIYSGEQYEVYA